MLQKGERLKWWHQPKDGYGYTLAVPCRYVKFGDWNMVIVDVLKRDGALIRKKILATRLVRESDGVSLNLLRAETVTA